MSRKTLAMPEKNLIPGLAAKLTDAREAAGLSQVDAGEKSGIHHITIARYETDKRVPTLYALYKLAEAYGVKICDLLPESLSKEKGEKKPKK